jgi:chromosome segregation ATPase
MIEWTPIIVALITTLLGGLAVRWLGHALDRKKIKFDESAVFRQELREDNLQLKRDYDDLEAKYWSRMREAEEATDRWRVKYYELRDDYNKLQFETMKEIQRLNSELRRCESEIRESSNENSDRGKASD